MPRELAIVDMNCVREILVFSLLLIKALSSLVG